MRFRASSLLSRLVFCLSAFAAIPAMAADRALIVGISKYVGEAQFEIADLNGPANDATQFWRLLKSRGFADENMTVLADEIPDGPAFPKSKADPTLAAIEAELEALASADYEPGDVVIYYHSGHGVTAPDDDPAAEPEPEAQGRDQVLLPRDAGRFMDDDFRIQNGLYDDMLGAYLNRIKAKGATVWVVIDACNSGGVTRGVDGSGDVQVKGVEPEKLGITAEDFAKAGAAAQGSGTRGADRTGMVDTRGGAGEGKIIGFYAVDSYNLAYVRSFKPAQHQEPAIFTPPSRPQMSVFTRHLVDALDAGTANTYQELFVEVLARLNADEVNATNPRPVADGATSEPLPGKASEASRVLALVAGDGRMNVGAGVLQGFDEGAGITLFTRGENPEAVGEATIEQATAVSSIASGITWKGATAPSLDQPFAVRVTRPVASMDYRIARPAGSDDAAKRADRLVTEAFGDATAQTEYGVELAAADDQETALALQVADGQLWLAPSGRPLVTDPDAFDQPYSIKLDGEDDKVKEQIRDAAWRLARAEKLVRVATLFPGSNENGVVFNAGRYRKGPVAMEGRKACEPRDRLTDDERAKLSSVEEGDILTAGNCDVVYVSVENRSSTRAYFVAPFYVEARGAVMALLNTQGNGASNNCAYDLPAGSASKLSFEVQVNTWDGEADRPLPVGREHIVMLVIEKDDTRSPPPFCALEQESLVKTRAVGNDNSPVAALFNSVAGGTRGTTSVKDISMQAFKLELDVAP